VLVRAFLEGVLVHRPDTVVLSEFRDTAVGTKVRETLAHAPLVVGMRRSDR
jgi:hypothetical protein